LILFVEVARRANKALGHAQVFTLFYLSGAIMVTASQLQGGFHGGLGALWGQFFIQSDAADAAGLADRIPSWVAPSDPEVLGRRSLLMWEWAGPIALIAFTMIIGRIDNMILGYGLFRLTSDIEKLPFPMAPVGAQGILALSEEESEEDADWDSLMPDDPPEEPAEPPDLKENRGWRWRVFSVGAVLGLAFGTVYLGLPTVTAALLGEPIVLIPIPFIDYTQRTADVLPAVATGVSLDLGQLILGMVLPFWAMVGTAVGLAVTFIANPFLYDAGLLNAWNPGDNLQTTFFKNNVDFYLSFSLGVAAAIAVAGFWSVGKALLKARREARAARDDENTIWQGIDVPEGRGDIRPWLVILTYAVSTALYLGVSCWLLYLSDGRIPLSLIVVMLFYALFYTPIISYVTARLEGIAGEVINVPYVREASFILSGYEGVAVWFLPVPLHNYGSTTVFYRQCELTGTKFKSIWKSELLLTPIILVGSLAFAHFIWQLGPIPGPNYPYAQAWWEVTAEDQALLFSSTLGGFSEFERAIDPTVILAGLGIGGLVFGGLSWLGAPVFLTYGIVRGLNQTLPYAVLPQLLGALIGRYYFQRRLGLKWRQYVPVVAAGFSCGMGLIGTLGVGFTFLAKSVFQLPY
ncbi:MAG: peptide transporter, partial [Planctomycetota bacterium]